MTEHEIENQEMADEAVQGSRNTGVRRLIWGLVVITLISLLVGLVAIGITLSNYYSLNKESLGLARQVQAECDRGEVKASICAKADKVEKRATEAPDPIPVPGIPGPSGKPGEPGASGKPGVPGKPGPSGKPGEDGEDADPAEPGQDGSPGAVGASGAPGASAYELAVGTGFQGTLEDWLASLKGEKGDSIQGEPGEDAWPFSFEFAFTSRVGQEYTCLIEIGEDGTQTNSPAACQAVEEPDPDPDPLPTIPASGG
jgi:hypothetical protein